VSTGGLVLQHGALAPPGLLADWMAERGIPMTVHHADGPDPCPDPRGYDFVACLGSRYGPHDVGEPSVVAGRTCLERAVEHDVPVLGLCFGGQLLASVLGGEVASLDAPELGWRTIETDDPAAVPAGPWLQWHWQWFTTPPGADEIARSPTGTQAFRHGRHLGVQFHPESTIEIVAGWADTDHARLAAVGVPDGRALLEEGRAHAAPAAANARRLFDAFWDHARTTGRSTIDGAR
jgi:GMP synthase-like glutamine amidotransferase